MVDSYLRWLGGLTRWRVSLIAGGKGRPRKITSQIIKRDSYINNLSSKNLIKLEHDTKFKSKSIREKTKIPLLNHEGQHLQVG